MFSAATSALRLTATRPLWIVPAALFLAIAIGVAAITAVGVVAYTNATANTNPSYYQLVYTIFYTLEIARGSQVAAAPPDAFVSAEGIATTMAGAWTVQYAGLALVFLLATLLLVASYAYARALVLGLIRDVQAGTKATLFTMFRAAREYWMPSLRYALPFALLAWIGVVVMIPLVVQDLARTVLGIPSFSLDVFLIVMLTIGTLLAAATVLGENSILAGSRRPIRDSIISATLKPLRTLAVIGMCILAAIVVIMIDYGRTKLAPLIPNIWLALGVFIVFVVIVAAWRVWAAAFVCALPSAGNRTAQTPRDE